MVQILLVGSGAGAASALLFASMASGSPFALLLFCVSGLPILIAALGWTHWTGLFAAAVGAISLAVAFGAFFFIAFLLTVGVPAWFLAYLALLARPAATNGGGTLEWYPAGRLVVWAAILGALVVIVAIPQLGLDADSYRAALRRGFERMIRVQTGLAADAPLQVPGVQDPNRLIDFLVQVMPPAAAFFTTAILVFNLYVAGRVVAVSGRLARPWPDITGMQFPPFATILLGVAIAGTFLPDLIGIVSGILSASLILAFSLLGLAVLHSVTRGMVGRGLVIAGVYFLILIFGWPLLAAAMLGLIETFLDLRQRMARKRGPPPPPARTS